MDWMEWMVNLFWTYCPLCFQVYAKYSLQQNLVSHGKGTFTATESFGDLRGCPDGNVAPAHVLLIEDVCEAANLVLLVVEEGLECHHMGSHEVTDIIFTRVESSCLRENHTSAMLVSIWENKNVSGIYKLRQRGVLEFKSDFKLTLGGVDCWA